AIATSSRWLWPTTPDGWERSDHLLSRAVRSCALYTGPLDGLTFSRAPTRLIRLFVASSLAQRARGPDGSTDSHVRRTTESAHSNGVSGECSARRHRLAARTLGPRVPQRHPEA